MTFTVYILECSDGSYYTGLTRRPMEERLWEHNAGVVEGYTHSRRPVVVRCVETTESAREAITRERQIKGWSRRKKEALMAGDYEGLPALARTAAARPRGSTGSP
ncbi:GIY-YIG nuclease family protein [Devosia psychrophila]|uniref:Putative endonuclease n=1 Tax=Devosia psychrophila TaxID=728005 RepID=A0A1I1K9V1_9HYPH|nr:GIY-YIG nuclease family protein [Devosia psychrophila]SFC57072.1 putative endonuclease [Devosia psychrophila]